MEIKTVKIEKPEDMMVNAVPFAKFGVAFCEASGPCLVRYTGTDEELIELAKTNAYALSAGHSFILFMKDIFPINVLKAIQNVSEVCRIFCATANPTGISDGSVTVT